MRAILAVTVWLPWLTTRAGGGGRANAIGGIVGNLSLPPHFGAGQLIALLASTLIVAGAMAARGLSARVASSAALAISVLIAVLTMWYYRLYVHPPVSAGYGLYIGAAVTWLRDRVVGVDDGGGVGMPSGDGVMTGFVEPVTLTGQRWVSLEPLSRDHVPEIAAARPTAMWAACGSPVRRRRRPPSQWVDMRLGLQKPDTGLTFVVRRLDGTLVGSSSYLNVDAPNRRLEIGNTWYGASARRSGVNSETKLLMLGHAFDELGCVAVEFRTHFFNFASRTAIERLGAKLDGILRSHQLVPDGTRRDTVVYSILDVEWPTVRTHLQFRLDRHG